MGPTRRQFSVGCGVGAAAWLVPGHRLARAAPEIPADKLEQLTAVALEKARKAGATYADIRINRYRSQTVVLRSHPDFSSGKLNHVPMVSDSETFGFGVRALADGAWGFAAAQRVSKDEIARAAADAVAIAKTNAPLRREPVRLAPVKAQRGTYATRVAKDPFAVPLGDKLAFLHELNEEIKKVAGVFSATSRR
jgi:TldD protein